jgi:hypothetical protein
MRHLTSAAALTLAAVALFFAGPALADIEYPYCGKGREAGGGCTFATMEQCQAFVTGTGGYCYNNPRYTLTANARPQRTRR